MSFNPEDYMTDPQGRLVPKTMIKELDKNRDELVIKLVKDAKVVQEKMAEFKKIAMSEIKSFIELAAMEWNVTLGGEKGNVTFYSYDGRYKVQKAVAEIFAFDEQLQVAKKMIDECLTEWTEGGDDKIKVIITDAFQVNKEGQIDVKRILGLRRLNIKDPLWVKAMDAIAASLQVIGTKEYIRVYERDEAKDPWRPVALDMASI